jgi:hypothetical protein
MDANMSSSLCKVDMYVREEVEEEYGEHSHFVSDLRWGTGRELPSVGVGSRR